MPACPGCGVDNPERARFCLDCGSALSAGSQPHESRRVVTILFSDVVGSTALGELFDQETLRGVMSRYFAAMEAVIERHGGTVEKFIGDAIMAVFGLSALHEDDALRAVRAAVEMRESLASLNVQLEAERGVTIMARTGVNTGEVVAGDPSARQSLVTGDAVNTAARLEQAAGPGEILIGRTTWRLVRDTDAVAAEQVAAIAAKGKATPVQAVRLLSVGSEQGRRGPQGGTPLVGRKRELERLRSVFEHALDDRRPVVVTVLGPAGVGKSRLVTEFATGAADRATVLRGRCLPYGEGITYWPLRDVLHAAAGIGEVDASADGLHKLERLVGDARDGLLIAAKLASAIGLSADPAPREEIFWAARRTLEHLASGRPLVVIIEDIHWAEPTLLELVEHLADHARDVPLLVVCPARPELLDGTPGWGGGRPNGTTITLEGLASDAAVGLIDALPGGSGIPTDLREKILARAEGNPLFVEEMVRMLVEDERPAGLRGARAPDESPPSVEVPPTIQALLAARIDRLGASERAVAQRGSVVGRVFEEASVVAMTPPTAQSAVSQSLLALVRRELLIPEHAELTGGDAFKFRHILIRDAAYDALTKAERAELHERFADWLEGAAGSRAIEYQEILGYHLEQAYLYRTELREAPGHTAALGSRAAAKLRVAGKRARDRGDSAAAVGLYVRAERPPIPDPQFRAELLLECGLALWDIGRLSEARSRAEGALEMAARARDRRLAARARLLRLDVSLSDGSLVELDQAVRSERDAALRDAEASRDPLALALAWREQSALAWYEGRFSDSSHQLRLALEHARGAADARFELDIELDLLTEAVAGPTPAGKVVAVAESMLAGAASYPKMRAEVLRLLAIGEAMLRRSDQASTHAAESIEILRDLRQTASVANARSDQSWVDRLAGDLAAAEADLRQGLAESSAIGDVSLRSLASCRLAQVLVAQGRLDEASGALVEAERVPIVMNRSRVAGIRARLRAASGDPAAATEVDDLLVMVAKTSFVNIKTDAFIDAAEAMASLGDASAASGHARTALGLAEAKENFALAGQIRILLERLEG